MIIILQPMNSLDETVKGFYGQNFVRTQVMKWNVHHLYALYEHQTTKEKLFLRLVELPAFLHISQEIAELYNKKYGSILSPLKIIPVDRHFQSCLYLIRTPNNIILLNIYIQIIMECQQFIEPQFFSRLFLFIIKSYRLLKDNKLPLFEAHQIGLSQSLQLSLCDPSLYFKNVIEDSKEVTFGIWLSKLMRQLLKIPNKQQEIDDFLGSKILQSDIMKFIKQILIEKYCFEQFITKVAEISKRQQDNTTVSSSFIDIKEYYDRNHHESLLVQDKVKFNTKVGSKLGKTILVFIIFSLLLASSYFLFRYFNRSIICGQSQYLSDGNVCLSCSQGCLRCADSRPNHCSKCKNNMYLVLDQAEDKEGFCLTQCRGRLINMDVCIRQKQKILKIDQMLLINEAQRYSKQDIDQ